jgi:hypothetical protein
LRALQARGLRLYVASCFAVHPRECGCQAVCQAGTDVVLAALDIKLVVLAQQLERLDLVGELELHAADLAGILAAAVHELLDGHLGQRGPPRRRQLVDRRHRIVAADISLPHALAFRLQLSAHAQAVVLAPRPPLGLPRVDDAGGWWFPNSLVY